jgi:hypothetical protein
LKALSYCLVVFAELLVEKKSGLNLIVLSANLEALLNREEVAITGLAGTLAALDHQLN